MQVIQSYGMGVESTAILVRWAREPATRWFDWKDLVVVTAMTGDEFPDTKTLVEGHVLPLLREHGVRFVQVARNGPLAGDGWTVLDDSRSPTVLHLEGVHRLSDEMRVAGTTPQVSSRRCSIKFKGWVLDRFIAQLLGGRVVERAKKTIIEVPVNFEHVMGFNVEERSRIERDRICGGPRRHGRYPLVEWGWDRARCLAYLREAFGVTWEKSCCVFCPFANGKLEILARYRAFPERAADALLLEHVALALNPRSTLYRDRTLYSVLEADGNEQALMFFSARIHASKWAVYRIRRIYRTKGVADRQVTRLARGHQEDMVFWIREHGGGGQTEFVHGSLRLPLRVPSPGVYPSLDEFLVVAPDVVDGKCVRKNFDTGWHQLARACEVA